MAPAGLKGTLFLSLLVCSLAAAAQKARQDITIEQRMMVLESDGSRLKVNELFTVSSVPTRNKAVAPRLEIYLPDGAVVEQATARSDNIKSLKTTVVRRAEKNRYAFSEPVRPGQNQFTVTYTLPYNGALRINPQITGLTTQLMVVAPDTMRLIPEDSSALTPASDPQLKNVTVCVASNVTPRTNLGFEVQGSGSLARSQKAVQSPASAQRRPTGTANGPEESARQKAPAAAVSSPWIFLAVLFLFLAAGATYVYSVNQASPLVSASPPAPSLLAEMKEEMFQLESDRLQGKLSPEEYNAAKAALDRAISKAVERAGRQ